MDITYDFNAIDNGTLLDAAGLGFSKLSGSGSATIVVNNGKLNFVGTAASTFYAYETGQRYHGFSVTWGGSGLGGNYVPCCIRILSTGNCIAARITSANNLEVGKFAGNTLTLYAGGTIALTRTAADVVSLEVDDNDLITCKVNGVIKFQVTDTSYNTSTKVGLCARTTASNGVIDAVGITYVTITSINGGANIQAGQSNISSITSGYTGLPTSITTNLAGVTCSNVGGTQDAPTFDLSDRVDGGFYPKDGTSAIFKIKNSSGIAELTKTISKKSTETKIVLNAPVTNNTTYFAGAVYDQTGRTLATGDEVYLTPYDDLVMGTDSGITVTSAGTFTCWVYINSGADAGKNYFYTVTVAAGGGVITVSRRTLKNTLKRALKGLLKGIL